jgi:hypothetical protein
MIKLICRSRWKDRDRSAVAIVVPPRLRKSQGLFPGDTGLAETSVNFAHHRFEEGGGWSDPARKGHLVWDLHETKLFGPIPRQREFLQ